VLPLLNRCGWTQDTLTYVTVSDLSDLAREAQKEINSDAKWRQSPPVRWLATCTVHLQHGMT